MRDFSDCRTTTTFLPRSDSASASVWAEQPVTSTGPSGLARERVRMRVRALWSAREVTVQVLTTCTSASAAPAATRNPAARNDAASASVSYWLSLHPKV